MPVPDQRRPLIAIAFVAVAWLAFRVLGQDLSPAGEGLLKVGLWVVPCFVVVRRSTGLSWRGLTRALGLAGSMWGGIAFGVLATLPILAMVAARAPRSPGVVYILSFQLARIIRDWNVVVGNVLTGPYAEEVLFRGFLLFELSTVARWPAWRVIAISGVLFGLAHLGNGGSVVVDGVTQDSGFLLIPGIALGGAVFAWIALHRRTIWPAIGLHACLNLWWDLFPSQALLGHAPSLLVAGLIVFGLRAFDRRRATDVSFARGDATQSMP
jgi:membrane protease YdiL (CAAX protease family)